jgi:hypothetical protein
MKVHPETIYQTVRIFDEQSVKVKSKPTVKAHTDASQAVMEARPFSWRSNLSEPTGGTNQLPAIDEPHSS